MPTDAVDGAAVAELCVIDGDRGVRRPLDTGTDRRPLALRSCAGWGSRFGLADDDVSTANQRGTAITAPLTVVSTHYIGER